MQGASIVQTELNSRGYLISLLSIRVCSYFLNTFFYFYKDAWPALESFTNMFQMESAIKFSDGSVCVFVCVFVCVCVCGGGD